MGNCNCSCRNGSDKLDFLLSSGTEGVFELGLTHFTCGGRKMLLSDSVHPVTAQLEAIPIGQPQSLGNSVYCQECQITGTVTYKACGCCEPRTEYVSYQCCLPCPSDAQPKLAIETVVASPKAITYYQNNGCGCCQGTYPCTNQITLTTSIAVTAGT